MTNDGVKARSRGRVQNLEQSMGCIPWQVAHVCGEESLSSAPNDHVPKYGIIRYSLKKENELDFAA